jgi:hypothetical protein
MDRSTAATAQFRKEAVECVGGAIFADPEQDATLQIVDHRQVVVPFAATHLVDSDDVQRAALAMPQTIGHGLADDPGHGFPVELVMTSSFSPLKSRAITATERANARVTRAHGSAQGTDSTRTPQRGQSTRYGW